MRDELGVFSAIKLLLTCILIADTRLKLLGDWR
jgi:hypothetical protein